MLLACPYKQRVMACIQQNSDIRHAAIQASVAANSDPAKSSAFFSTHSVFLIAELKAKRQKRCSSSLPGSSKSSSRHQHAIWPPEGRFRYESVTGLCKEAAEWFCRLKPHRLKDTFDTQSAMSACKLSRLAEGQLQQDCVAQVATSNHQQMLLGHASQVLNHRGA